MLNPWQQKPPTTAVLHADTFSPGDVNSTSHWPHAAEARHLSESLSLEAFDAISAPPMPAPAPATIPAMARLDKPPPPPALAAVPDAIDDASAAVITAVWAIETAAVCP